tara:strand:+ start:2369 stop:3928 length:1560 start_codon:yes stop_codon:yes gene_type:complete
MKNLFVMTLTLSSLYPSSQAFAEFDSEKFVPAQGASYSRMWNWILKGEGADQPKEKPVLGMALCQYDGSKMNPPRALNLGSGGDDDRFSTENLIKNLAQRSSVTTEEPCLVLRSPGSTFNDNLLPLLSISQGSLPLQTFLSSYSPKVVSSYGSESHYVPQPINENAPTTDANNFIANELIRKCVAQLQSDARGVASISADQIARGTSIVAVSSLDLSLEELQENIEPNLSAEAQVVNGRANLVDFPGVIHSYSFSQFPISYSLQERLNLKESLIGELSCAEGELWGEDGIVRVNECNPILAEMREEIEEGSSNIKTALSGAACGIGRRLEGNGSLLVGALACSLTEVISRCEDESVVRTLRNSLALFSSAFLAGSVPNGSALTDTPAGDLSYINGGYEFTLQGKQRERLGGAAAGALLGGALRGLAFGECQDGYRERQVVGNSVGAVAIYTGMSTFASDRFQYAGVNANKVHELASGSIPGIIRSQCRQNACTQRLRQTLQEYSNNSTRLANPQGMIEQ